MRAKGQHNDINLRQSLRMIRRPSFWLIPLGIITGLAWNLWKRNRQED